uniref:Nudix hydrolase domain-containing protein n=1 Tax=Meloidogyne javanica TaxID=6303 RepID=A0A915MVG6_MELJA
MALHTVICFANKWDNRPKKFKIFLFAECPWVRVYDNVTYIVAAIALREGKEGREVLLMREAKEKCRGKWYIPAGHVEPGETIE